MVQSYRLNRTFRFRLQAWTISRRI